jgi:hypothetical protein
MAFGLELDAGTVMSLMPFMSTTRRLFDPFKEPEKIREEWRANYAQTQGVQNEGMERDYARDRQMREISVGGNSNRYAPAVNASAPEGAVSLASLKPVMLR